MSNDRARSAQSTWRLVVPKDQSSHGMQRHPVPKSHLVSMPGFQRLYGTEEPCEAALETER